MLSLQRWIQQGARVPTSVSVGPRYICRLGPDVPFRRIYSGQRCRARASNVPVQCVQARGREDTQPTFKRSSNAQGRSHHGFPVPVSLGSSQIGVPKGRSRGFCNARAFPPFRDRLQRRPGGGGHGWLGGPIQHVEPRPSHCTSSIPRGDQRQRSCLWHPRWRYHDRTVGELPSSQLFRVISHDSEIICAGGCNYSCHRRTRGQCRE